MRSVLLVLAAAIAGCSAVRREPAACVRNQAACFAAYTRDQAWFCGGRYGRYCTQADWDALCRHDAFVCRGDFR